MNSVSGPFPTSSFVKAKLLREPIYREDGELWDALRAAQDDIRHYFRQIGQELVLDDGEGFAFIRQLEMEGEERIPRLIRKRALSYHATLLLVCLREELVRFDSRADDAARLVKSRAELHALVTAFVPESNNQVRDVNKMESAIKRLEELGFLRALGVDRDAFEVMCIVKARVTPGELDSVKERLLRHAQSEA
jgi:hypothetical protein